MNIPLEGLKNKILKDCDCIEYADRHNKVQLHTNNV